MILFVSEKQGGKFFRHSRKKKKKKKKTVLFTTTVSIPGTSKQLSTSLLPALYYLLPTPLQFPPLQFLLPLSCLCPIYLPTQAPFLLLPCILVDGDIPAVDSTQCVTPRRFIPRLMDSLASPSYRTNALFAYLTTSHVSRRL